MPNNCPIGDINIDHEELTRNIASVAGEFRRIVDGINDAFLKVGEQFAREVHPVLDRLYRDLMSCSHCGKIQKFRRGKLPRRCRCGNPLRDIKELFSESQASARP